MAKKADGLNRRTYLKVASVGALGGLAGCLGGDDTGPPIGETWTVGTPGEGSTLHNIASALARVLDQYNDDLDLEVGSYGGSEEAIRLVGRGEDEMAAAALPLGAAAYNNEEPVPDGPTDFTGDSAVETKAFQGINPYDFRLFWITLEDSGIETVEDFAGQDVSVGPTGADFNNMTFLSVAGMLDEVNTTNNEWSDVAPALTEGRIDAGPLYATNGVVAPGWAAELLSNEDVRIVEYTPDQLDAIAASGYANIDDSDLVEIFDIDPPQDTVDSCRVPYGYFFSEELDTDLVYSFVETVFENIEEIQDYDAAAEDFTLEYAAEGLTPEIPVHPGFAEYLQDEGMWDDDLTQG